MDKQHSTILDRCPYIKGLKAGDESLDYCELTQKLGGAMHICDLVTKDTCDEWEEIKGGDNDRTGSKS